VERPGCRVPAHRADADADHSIEHAERRETTDANLGPGCRHGHRLRHEGGWTLTHTEPGRFTWKAGSGTPTTAYPHPSSTICPNPCRRPNASAATMTPHSTDRPLRTGVTARAWNPNDPNDQHPGSTATLTDIARGRHPTVLTPVGTSVKSARYAGWDRSCISQAWSRTCQAMRRAA
jgi:hypothetical protein